ncbi:MAG TPA: chemotaxis protein CheX [Symbiobacteriaceae bacterium]|jgi:chemotaxis protein CheX|nr:chemotaxis protein CheX [Symbiobacteriaceae bacterium]
MQGKLADPFVTAAVRVLTLELGSEVAQHDRSAEEAPLAGSDVTVMIGITGGVKGLMALSMSTETAGAIAGFMMGGPAAQLDEMGKSAVAELGNMIAGLATVELEQEGYPSNITPPSVVTGKETEISTGVGVGRVVAPLTTTFGHIAIHVALKVAA